VLKVKKKRRKKKRIKKNLTISASYARTMP